LHLDKFYIYKLNYTSKCTSFFIDYPNIIKDFTLKINKKEKSMRFIPSLIEEGDFSHKTR
ncbi:MAG: hypothetical protein ACRDAT_05485, partial [Cetobacterium sp.]